MTTNPAGPEASRRAWWRGGTIYQVYPHSFADGNGDGLGDLSGMLSKVPHLKWLGVDAVWLSPVYPSPQRDNGYDVSDYCAIDPRFGTLEDMDRLIAGLHDSGIRLIMDLVVNHTSAEHPWFVDACSSRDSEHRDWYIWRDPRPGFTGGEQGAEPTDWGSFFSQSAWTWHEPTKQYYLHLYAAEQPDLDWTNPAVRSEVHRIMKWWLDRGVDGFRMDVINLISKPDEFSDGHPSTPGTFANPSPFVVHGPHLEEYLREMHSAVFAGRSPELIRIGETPSISADDARRLTHQREAGLDMVFQFEHMELDRAPGDRLRPAGLEVSALRENLAKWQAAMSTTGWNTIYANNHDQPRMVSRFGDPSPEHWKESAKAVALALYLLKGTVSMFQGEEIGMTGATLRGPGDFRDIRSLNYLDAEGGRGRDLDEILEALAETARDNARTPMQWNGDADAGFGSIDPWMPFAEHSPRITVAAQRDDPDSILHFYRRLIALRRQLPVIAEGSTRMFDLGRLPIIAYLRTDHAQTLLVVANLSSDESDLPAELARLTDAARVDYVLRSRDRVAAGTLAPWEAYAAILDSTDTA